MGGEHGHGEASGQPLGCCVSTFLQHPPKNNYNYNYYLLLLLQLQQPLSVPQKDQPNPRPVAFPENETDPGEGQRGQA